MENSEMKNFRSYYMLAAARILFGCVFIFSGFVKAIDPLGSTYKFEDYFHSFGGAFEQFASLAFPLAILLAMVEWVIGWCFVMKVHLRVISYIALAFMSVMTLLTLYLAIKNPVSDCGCFGDAIVLSNWATFYKNLLLLALLIPVVLFLKQIKPFLSCRSQFISIAVFALVSISVSAYCYRHLPLIDFLPYKVGVNIPAAMTIPDGAPTDKYETTFIYEKNGVKKEFTLENYPKGDASWKFVDQKTVLLQEGFRPSIHDFSIVDENFEDITDRVVYNQGSTYLLIMYNLDESSVEGAKKAEQIYKKALTEGASFYALTASSDDAVAAFKTRNGLTYPFCKTDPTTLKTIIRANPGMILVKNGTIEKKWNWRDF